MSLSLDSSFDDSHKDVLDKLNNKNSFETNDTKDMENFVDEILLYTQSNGKSNSSKEFLTELSGILETKFETEINNYSSYRQDFLNSHKWDQLARNLQFYSAIKKILNSFIWDDAENKFDTTAGRNREDNYKLDGEIWSRTQEDLDTVIAIDKKNEGLIAWVNDMLVDQWKSIERTLEEIDNMTENFQWEFANIKVGRIIKKITYGGIQYNYYKGILLNSENSKIIRPIKSIKINNSEIAISKQIDADWSINENFDYTSVAYTEEEFRDEYFSTSLSIHNMIIDWMVPIDSQNNDEDQIVTTSIQEPVEPNIAENITTNINSPQIYRLMKNKGDLDFDRFEEKEGKEKIHLDMYLRAEWYYEFNKKNIRNKWNVEKIIEQMKRTGEYNYIILWYILYDAMEYGGTDNRAISELFISLKKPNINEFVDGFDFNVFYNKYKKLSWEDLIEDMIADHSKADMDRLDIYYSMMAYAGNDSWGTSFESIIKNNLNGNRKYKNWKNYPSFAAVTINL